MTDPDKKKKKKSLKKGVVDTSINNDDRFVVDDDRFAAATTRPQFQNRRRQEEQKVVLDDRFASVLTDSRFSISKAKDKRGGKKKKKKHDQASELSAFYTVQKDGEEEEAQDDGSDEKDAAEEDAEPTLTKDDNKEKEEDMDPASRIAYLTALSRGELNVSDSSDAEDDESESSGDDDDESIAEEEEEVYGKAGILDPAHGEDEDVSLTEVPSPYMAIMNVDWSNVRAVDLFCIVSSFSPPKSVRKVQVYPSNFGIKCMERDRLYGPSNVWNSHQEEDEHHEGSDDDGSESEERDTTASDNDDGGFDVEKLREYEASKLKYFFAIVEFASPQQADVAYKELDGMEFERSSAKIDMRSIDPDQLIEVTKDRKVRDEALTVPSNYEPPEFVISALQQSNVECTWDEGDREREAKLTKYNSGRGWDDIADKADLRDYLASDHSSDEESFDYNQQENEGRGSKKSKLRKLLGLGGGASDQSSDETSDGDSKDDDEKAKAGSDSESDDFLANDGDKEAVFVPGKKSLEDKIRNKLKSKNAAELASPWEKYKEKRKQKRRERRQAARRQRKDVLATENDDDDDDDESRVDEDDDFFFDEEREAMKQENKQERKKKKKKKNKDNTGTEEDANRAPSSKEELELLVAGEEEEDTARDYDMRGLLKKEKLKGKKLKGSRKRKESQKVTGSEFKIDTKDDRFAAVLKGSDGRFGIDPTDSNFKDTNAMREILSEQTKQRRKKAKKNVVPDVQAKDGSLQAGGGASSLSMLVKSIKSKVAQKEGK